MMLITSMFETIATTIGPGLYIGCLLSGMSKLSLVCLFFIFRIALILSLDLKSFRMTSLADTSLAMERRRVRRLGKCSGFFSATLDSFTDFLGKGAPDMRGTSTRVRMKEKRGIFLIDKACSLRLEWWEESEESQGGRWRYKQPREGEAGWAHVNFSIRERLGTLR